MVVADNPVYQIAKWSTTFETKKSLGYKKLNWFCMPIALHSNGFLTLADEFEDDAPALYGAWCALLQVAAECPVRGILTTSRGIGLTPRRVGILTGFPEEIFERLFSWATCSKVQWIIELDETSITQLSQSLDGGLAGDCQATADRLTGSLDRQRHHPTQPKHQPNQTTSVSPVFESWLDWESEETYQRFVERCKAILKVRKASRDAEVLILQIGYLSMHMPDDWYIRFISDWRGGELRTPARWLRGCAIKACEQAGYDWEQVKEQQLKLKSLRAKNAERKKPVR